MIETNGHQPSPFYEDVGAGLVVYHGDCRDVLPWIWPDEVALARNLGAGEVSYFGSVGYGGGAGPGVVGHAALAVAAGQCDVAVAWLMTTVSKEPVINPTKTARRVLSPSPGIDESFNGHSLIEVVSF